MAPNFGCVCTANLTGSKGKVNVLFESENKGGLVSGLSNHKLEAKLT